MYMEEFKNLFSNKNTIASNNKTTIKRNRRPKHELFEKEREEIITKINEILGINNDNNILYLYDLQNDMDKKEKILALVNDIQKYFSASDWGFFKKESSRENYILLCKSVYKDMNWQVFSSNTNITRDNKKIRTIKYGIIKK